MKYKVGDKFKYIAGEYTIVSKINNLYVINFGVGFTYTYNENELEDLIKENKIKYKKFRFKRELHKIKGCL